MVPFRLGAAPWDALRLYDLQPSVFDYVLTGLSRDGDGRPRLSFNDRAGNTHFKRQGEHLGPYCLTRYAIMTNRAFNASLNAIQESRVVTAELTGTSGTNIALIQGERLPAPGFTARLVALDTGLGWALRRGDGFMCGSITMRVDTVTATSTTVAVLGGPSLSIPPISTNERTALAALWAANERQRVAAVRERAAAQASDAVAQADQPAAAFPPPPSPAPFPAPPRRTDPVRTGMSVGTYYWVPTEFQVIPAQWDTSGHLISERVVVPRHFETRFSGVSVSYGP